jgi:hypothetical protein
MKYEFLLRGDRFRAAINRDPLVEYLCPKCGGTQGYPSPSGMFVLCTRCPWQEVRVLLNVSHSMQPTVTDPPLPTPPVPMPPELAAQLVQIGDACGRLNAEVNAAVAELRAVEKYLQDIGACNAYADMPAACKPFLVGLRYDRHTNGKYRIHCMIGTGEDAEYKPFDECNREVKLLVRKHIGLLLRDVLRSVEAKIKGN